MIDGSLRAASAERAPESVSALLIRVPVRPGKEQCPCAQGNSWPSCCPEPRLFAHRLPGTGSPSAYSPVAQAGFPVFPTCLMGYPLSGPSGPQAHREGRHLSDHKAGCAPCKGPALEQGPRKEQEPGGEWAHGVNSLHAPGLSPPVFPIWGYGTSNHGASWGPSCPPGRCGPGPAALCPSDVSVPPPPPPAATAPCPTALSPPLCTQGKPIKMPMSSCPT